MEYDRFPISGFVAYEEQPMVRVSSNGIDVHQKWIGSYKRHDQSGMWDERTSLVSEFLNCVQLYSDSHNANVLALYVDVGVPVGHRK